MPSAYRTTAFFLEGILVLRDAFEKRVVSRFGLHVVLDRSERETLKMKYFYTLKGVHKAQWKEVMGTAIY